MVTVKVAVAVLPAASCAVTVSTFVPACSAIPFAAHFLAPVAMPLPPTLFTHLTCVTPTLSAAVPASVSVVLFVVYVELDVGALIATVGGVVSTVTVRVAVPVLPAASCAVTVSTFVPACSAIPLAVQLVVPVAVPLPPRLFTHLTCVTPMLSAAVPASVSVVLLVV